MELMDCSETRSKRSAIDWANLPAELLILIVSKLTSIFHYIRFRSVCVSWRLAAGLTNLQPQLPWLVAPCVKDGRANTLSFFSLFEERRVCAIDLLEARGHWIYGSGHGWLLMIGLPTYLPTSSRPAASLFNPITRAQISLPKLPKGLDLTLGLKKFVLCSHPTSAQPGQLMVAVWISKRLAFFRQGGESWIIVNYLVAPVHDIAYFRQKLYVVDCDGQLYQLEENTPRLRLFIQLEQPHGVRSASFHIVEAAGEFLLLASRYERITVFKLYRNGNKESKWELEWVIVGTIATTFFQRSGSQIYSICAQGLPGCGGYRIYLAYSSRRSLWRRVAALVQVIDLVPGVGLIERPHFQVPGWSQRKWTPAGLTWMLPSLH